MRHQAFRTIALMLGVLLAAAPAAQAGTITFGELVRTAGANGQLRPASEVRLRLAAQAGSTQSGATSSEQQQAAGSQQQQQTSGGTSNVSAPATADPTLSQSGGQVETVDFGDVTGTVCDCGEIPVPPAPRGGGFPWWTLASLPLICVSGICAGGDDTPPTNPTPEPKPPIPEPLSLLLFGSGLLAVGAGARRRRGRKQLEAHTPGATTEEV